MNARCLSLCLALAAAAVAVDSTARIPRSDDLEKRAAQVKPSEAELAWQRIPWLTSLVEGERLAKQEKRPILYWNVDDDPLERC